MKRLITMLFIVLLALPAFAVEPDEVLDDPVLEARAREISQGLRCVVCRGENIDESNAGIAKDMRILVRERLMMGETDQQVMDFVVERYGEYVLMRPTTQGFNKLLWASPLVLFVLALLTAGVYLRRRASMRDAGNEALSAEEKARLADLMKG